MGSEDATAIAPDLAGLADELEAAWNAPGVSMRARQRLLRALTDDIISDVDRGRARGRPDDPLARPSLAAARKEAKNRRPRLPHA